jgi:hypothetical protein
LRAQCGAVIAGNSSTDRTLLQFVRIEKPSGKS